MAESLVQQLRRAIDAKYAEARRALDTLQSYLEEPAPSVDGQSVPPKKRAPRAGTGKIRNTVLAAFRQDFLSVQTVVAQTKLTIRQVRGVISAPGLTDKFARKQIEGVTHYKYGGDMPE